VLAAKLTAICCEGKVFRLLCFRVHWCLSSVLRSCVSSRGSVPAVSPVVLSPRAVCLRMQSYWRASFTSFAHGKSKEH
jgi:hypothetical protein